VKVLFVDDDPSVLGGLRRMLRAHRDRFETFGASSGPEALALMEDERFDVIVTDMRMPGMDGAELLEIVRRRSPDVVRIVLSGQLDDATAVRIAVLAHQFLSKPCEFEALIDAIDCSCGIRSRLIEPDLRRALGRLDALPSPRPTLQRLTDSLGGGDASVYEITELIRQDPAITAKLLQLVNSAFFGMPRHVSDVRDAVVYLGLHMIRDLVAAADVFHAFEDDDRIDRAMYEQIRADCVRTAEISAQLSGQGPDACVAGMLHDVGLLALAVCLPEELLRITALATRTETALHVVEFDELGTTHADIGAYLLTLWGFRDEIVEAVAYHHRAPDHPGNPPLTHLTYVAANIASKFDDEARPSLEIAESLDPAYLERVSLAPEPARVAR
jgi:HD-like signal output (HDOD) protein/ActR/RegA family two-component response regulator